MLTYFPPIANALGHPAQIMLTGRIGLAYLLMIKIANFFWHFHEGFFPYIHNTRKERKISTSEVIESNRKQEKF